MSILMEPIDYEKILSSIPKKDMDSLVSFLATELPFIWYDTYLTMTTHPVNISRIKQNDFEYIFDCYSELESLGTAPKDKNIEDRLVAVCGLSRAKTIAREKSRLQGWLGPTEKILGSERDKGHFIAHSIGGLADGLEINLFSQLRSLNRGWSEEGKLFRSMEKYCVDNPGTFVFNRPLYNDSSSRPYAIEFGILKSDQQFWIEYFRN